MYEVSVKMRNVRGLSEDACNRRVFSRNPDNWAT